MGSRESETSISQQFKDMQMCPARSEDQLVIEEDETCNGVIPDPWAVKQADDIDVFGCGHKKKSCKCPTRSMDSYSKVMAPFVQHWSRKKNTDKNPFTKSKNILLYEQQSRHMEELKMTTIAMNNSFSAKKKKYQKLYEQYVRTQNSKLITVLLQLEDELNDLTCALKEAIDVYKEAAFINKPETNSSNCLLDHIENPPTPKETTTVRLIKNLRRLQELQEKLKNGHFFQGSGDNMG
ncbi:Hypothetical protein CINCED_3A016010 [Cinara cedri]|uniref:Uncharacterized protein n=1 Tax=Cinara cedri TaxID=506608 RepID=A0A5E4N0D0_9HEMI|nr:Hypothetical protein CINCED_3A016010 [Cinara cedri]